MLELGQVVAQIADMSSEARRRAERVGDEMMVAMSRATQTGDEWGAVRDRLKTMPPPSWQYATIGPESPATTFPLPFEAPDEYTALATDGSHIPLDRHAIAPCYLVNVGHVALHYGTGECPLLASNAALYYKDDDIYATSATGDVAPLSERIVANKRLLAESDALASLIAEFHHRTAIALVDDPLVVWTPSGESDESQARVVARFCEMLTAGMQCSVPVAGYISRPGHRDVIGTLRMTLCPDDCTHAAGSACRRIAHLSDAHLFSRILSPGERTQVFGSNAANLKHYADEHKVGFYYLHTGSEVARVEVPKWVATDAALLSRVHVFIYNQVEKGQGYPVALAEAHERAIVRGPERESFFRLVEQSFIRNNVPAMQTRKAISKRTRML